MVQLSGSDQGTQPEIALLLDVDGPLANPAARTVVEPSMLPTMKSLLLSGVPIVLNTGRSADFVLEHVIRPLKALGGLPAAGFYAVGEQGAVWFNIIEGNEQPLQTDASISVPAGFADAVINMAARDFADTMFVDRTKLAMVSVEQRLDVARDNFVPAQKAFVAATRQIAETMGIPVIVDEPRPVDPIGTIRVHPTIISTDVEPAAVGKDLGAQRAWAMLRSDGLLPKVWRTVGDSPSDILMADWLHAQGEAVRHIDVSVDGTASTDRLFPVLRPKRLTLDGAGVAYLRWVLGGRTTDEESFDASQLL